MGSDASTLHADQAGQANAPAPRQIRSARALHEALTAPDPATRLGALKAVRAQPEAALAFGVFGGQDAIDLLLAQANRVRGHSDSEWLAGVSALSVFRDDRITAFFVAVLAAATEPTLLFAVARYLAAEPGVSLHDRLRPLLLQDDCPARARVVAQLLAPASVLTTPERLRIALLAEDDGPEPLPLNDTSADGWLAELGGAFHQEARAALEARGASAFAYLVGVWDRLTDDTRDWLVCWGLRTFPASAGLMVERALAVASDRLALVALEGFAALHQGMTGDTTALRRFAKHPDPALRRAAIVAGVGLDWRQYLATDPDPAVRRACVPRLAETAGLHAVPDLLALLHEPDWQMRAVATKALIGLGAAVVDPVKPLVHDPEQGVRVAAVQVLLALGQEAWLASQLMGTQ